MTLPTNRISHEQVLEIKKALWEGDQTQWRVARDFEISQGTVSNILRGYSHRNVRWPDGSMGEMSITRYRLKYGARTDRVIKYTREMRYDPFIMKAAAQVEYIIDHGNPKGETLEDMLKPKEAAKQKEDKK